MSGLGLRMRASAELGGGCFRPEAVCLRRLPLGNLYMVRWIKLDLGSSHPTNVAPFSLSLFSVLNCDQVSTSQPLDPKNES